VQKEKADLKPESDQGNCSIDPKTAKYKWGRWPYRKLIMSVILG
jgi:hypothetical protein